MYTKAQIVAYEQRTGTRQLDMRRQYNRRLRHRIKGGGLDQDIDWPESIRHLRPQVLRLILDRLIDAQLRRTDQKDCTNNWCNDAKWTNLATQFVKLCYAVDTDQRSAEGQANKLKHTLETTKMPEEARYLTTIMKLYLRLRLTTSPYSGTAATENVKHVLHRIFGSVVYDPQEAVSIQTHHGYPGQYQYQWQSFTGLHDDQEYLEQYEAIASKVQPQPESASGGLLQMLGRWFGSTAPPPAEHDTLLVSPADFTTFQTFMIEWWNDANELIKLIGQEPASFTYFDKVEEEEVDHEAEQETRVKQCMQQCREKCETETQMQGGAAPWRRP